MASHFARWTLVQSKPRVHRLPLALVEYAYDFDERRRSRFLAARTLLAELLLRIYGINRLPELTTLTDGRPAFADADLPDFSLAYAGNTVGVLLAEEGSRAGLDMEIVRAHSRQTLEHYFQCLTSAEVAWVRAQNDQIEAATQLWTLRQSILKLTGEGEKGNDSLRLHPASGRLRSAVSPDIQALCDVESVMVWSCALSPGTDRLRLWEFDGQESWESLQDINVLAQNMGPRMLRLTSLPPEKTPHSH
ncbi:4'-phosphopantetheinyl transferase superfamily protein [Erwinia sp. E602]|uniref:4'-phosphopantetheinyl transferase family protein n=1 Tax=unclassified Erwinia TaxID=2622719 RepID=UPI0006FBD864|nr:MULTISPECIES: 4'-phosphopantetheinyl transferase superfamily protein [unclassified Erwinia]KQN53883.1 phosphopantetheinyl transferase [Erwinia sp. Leaf53]PLV62358.1 phosphopantetheinyl transferase [Erwinia sp. B116]QUG77786.1 4'-phosphopantetheinyl transferase superfamily protein [Erwinia sp. E602]